MARVYNNGLKRKSPKRGPRKEYNVKKIEERGMTEKENRILTSFWKQFTMDIIEHLDDTELDALIDSFFQAYEKKHLAKDKSWWYPYDPKSRLVDLRYKK